MWADPGQHTDEHVGWNAYAAGRKAEIWSDVVERLTARTIILQHFKKRISLVYSCPQDAITAEYESFCFFKLHLGISPYSGRPMPSLGEASAVLRKLAELEFDLNNIEVRSGGLMADKLEDERLEAT